MDKERFVLVVTIACLSLISLTGCTTSSGAETISPSNPLIIDISEESPDQPTPDQPAPAQTDTSGSDLTLTYHNDLDIESLMTYGSGNPCVEFQNTGRL